MPVLDGDFEAFVTNLGKYNEGMLVGEWVKLPTTEEEMQKVFERIGIGKQDEFGQPYEEWFITDYECPIYGVQKMLGEYESLDKLNYLAALIDELSLSDQEKLVAIMEAGCDEVSDIENVKNSTVKPTERFREEGVGREPFSKGVSSDRLKCSSCRNGFGKILSSLFHGRKSSVGRVDPSQVVVMDVSVNHALYLIRCHFRRIHFVQLLLFQCSEKALHSRVVVTSARAAHALYRSVFFQAFAEHRACVLASPVAVQDHAARSRLFTCVLKCGAA